MPSDASIYPFVWLGATILFSIIEASTAGIVSIWFALGSLVALIAASLHAPLWLQILLFLVSSAVLLILTRPVVRRHLLKNITPTNSDMLIGESAIVTEKIDNIASSGTVKVDGKVWTARSDDGNTIDEGELVTVIKIDGVKLIVKKA